MYREVSLDVRRTGGWYDVVESRNQRREMDFISPNPAVQMIVGVRVIAEHKAIQRRRAPVPPDAAERKLAILPLATDVSILSATRELPVLSAGELGIDVESAIDQSSYKSDDGSAAHHQANRAARS